MVASALIGISSFHLFTKSQKNFFLSPFLTVFKHFGIDFNEFSIFSVFVLVPSIPVVNHSLLLLFDDFLVLTKSLVRSEIVVVFRIAEEISGHCKVIIKG